ncbi:hypothetical protein SHKM778_77490 [Streptomyces sp. KM77-8]|uniref:Uncharacterized protein n=1 Tax=Streptomyces haneummycinicus TaxID=3074435 RepID=A0AAT9HUM4_9ACTN
MHGQAEALAEGVEAGDLEGGEHGQAHFAGGLDAAQSADVDLAGDLVRVDGDRVGVGEQPVQVARLTADEPVGEGRARSRYLVSP